MSQYMEVVSTQGLINDISSAVETQALNTKQDKLTAGSGITISDQNVISATGGGGATYTAGDNISIESDVISVVGIKATEEVTPQTNYTDGKYYNRLYQEQTEANTKYLEYTPTANGKITFRINGTSGFDNDCYVWFIGYTNLGTIGAHSNINSFDNEDVDITINDYENEKIYFNFKRTNVVTPSVSTVVKEGELSNYVSNSRVYSGSLAYGSTQKVPTVGCVKDYVDSQIGNAMSASY